MKIAQTNRVALFIDYDNIQNQLSNIDLQHCAESQLWTAPLISEIENKIEGTVDIRKCYGNVMFNTEKTIRKQIYKGKEIRQLIEIDQHLQSDLVVNGFQMIHTPGLGISGKNRADLLIAVECIEHALKYDQINNIAVFTQDSDFTPVFHKLRAMGKNVILITTSDYKKNSPSFQSLFALANKHIVFDQELIDKSGFDILSKVLTDISNEEPHAIEEGLNLSTIRSRILKEKNTFNQNNIGYKKFKDFIDACLSDEYRLKGGLIGINTFEASDIKEFITEEKTHEIATILRKGGIRFNNEIRKLIINYFNTNKTVFDAKLTFKEIKEKITSDFYIKEKGKWSKSRLIDVIKVLRQIGYLFTDHESEIPPSQKKWSIAWDLNIEDGISLLAVRILFENGITITNNDLTNLSKLLFSDANDDKIAIVKNAIQLIKENEQNT